ncbi:hypothetical protein [Salinispira pacifica]
MFAARNITLCTKDCACLMVCPTGATDTENGQIDSTICLDGCRLCVDACPSHAIYLVPRKTAQRRLPSHGVTETLAALLSELSAVHYLARTAATGTEAYSRFMKALTHSTRILAEDCFREMGFISLDPERIRELAASTSVLSIFEKSYRTADEAKALAEEAASSAATGLDVSGPPPAVCGFCGRITIGSDAPACASCGRETVR